MRLPAGLASIEADTSFWLVVFKLLKASSINRGRPKILRAGNQRKLVACFKSCRGDLDGGGRRRDEG